MKRTLLLLLIAVATTITVFSQGEIPVNMYTGSPGIYVNLYTLSDHDLSESLTLLYDVNSVNRNAPADYGIGWSLSTGGQVSREVHGLPDDLTDFSGRRGWLYSSYSNISSFFPASSDLLTSTCSDETADNTWLYNLLHKQDTEPDIFSFSVGGYSGKFVFDNSGAIRLIPYQDIKIVPTFDATSSLITQWSITTPSGITYTLAEACSTDRKIAPVQSYLNLFEHDSQQYSTNITYNSSWLLTKTQSPSGAYFNYSYVVPPDGKGTRTMTRNIQIFDTGGNPSKIIYGLMTELLTTPRKLISKITASSGTYATIDPILGISIVEPLRSASGFKVFKFSYANGNLTSITESDANQCIQLPPYKFTYYGNAQWNAFDCGCSGSNDFWGFYNQAPNSGLNGPTRFPTIYVYPDEPANERYRIYRIPDYPGREIVLAGDANRTPDPNFIIEGTLSTIVYPTGGSAAFTFEINQYYDSKAGQNQNGGGMRIKSVEYFDGINKASNVVKNFSYVDVNGRSTGKLISRPSYVIPLWQQKIAPSTTKQYSQLTGDYVWRDLTAVTDFDLSNAEGTHGSTVGYSQVTVTRPGQGKSVLNYTLPAAYGDNATGGNSTDWSPTVMKFARPSSCPTMGIISSGETYGYALFPNPLYDYERGLITNKTDYNEAGIVVRSAQTTYQYIYPAQATAPVAVTGLAYDRFANSGANIYLYGKYSLLTNVAKVPLTETVTTYDENDVSHTKSSTVQSKYYFSSTAHKFLTKIELTTPEGNVYTTNMKYVADYPNVTSTSDSTTQMIYALQGQNRLNTVIEQWNTVRLGGLDKTTDASMLVFRPFTVSKPLLRYQLVYRPSSPDGSFASSGYDASSDNKFKPYGWTTSSPYGNYEKVRTITEYDAFDVPVSSYGESNLTSGTLWGYSQRLPVAQFSNARTTGIAYSDFETTSSSSFSVQNDYYGVGRTGTKAIHPYATLTRSNLVKPSIAINYVLSFWAKPQSGTTSLTLQVVFKDASNSVLSTTNYTFNYAGTDYQYFKQSIPVNSLPSAPSTFTIQIQGQSLSTPSGSAGSFNASLLPMLDDISFIPDYATLASVTYDFPFGSNSVTSASGITQYTTYDALGRAKWISDQDRNIRKRFTYSSTQQGTPLIAAIAWPATKYPVGVPVSFSAQANTCFPGATYQWDFGTGYSSVNSYTYSAIGNYTVKLKVTDPIGGTVIKSTPITVVDTNTANGPMTVHISGGVGASGLISLTATFSDYPIDMIKQWTWYARPTGTSTWNPVSNGNTNTLSRKQSPGVSMDYMCTGLSTYGSSGSGTITVVFN